MEFTHFNEKGRAKMVDVSEKPDTLREAAAAGRVFMKAETLKLIEQGAVKKGDVLAVAQVAGVMAAKKTGYLIPMCHPLFLTGIDLNFNIDKERLCIEVEAVVRTLGKTGVEMEALTAVSAACLTIYDMCKSVDREMVISDIRLMKKSGGKSGEFVRIEKGDETVKGEVVAVCTSDKKGMRKKNIGKGELIEGFGLKGDAHGGEWHRQVSLLAVESIEKMREKGLKVGPGDFAENITTKGLDLVNLPVGTRLKINDSILEVTQIGKECHSRCAIYYQAGDCVMPREGIFVRVLKGGPVQVGDVVEVI
ncbi:MAG: cyclic pyranopterin monophosphate synthase MoaC [Firmicutes bacterium]|nr:cyclic pyranopterin monophosphate synthase MoaC [Bacillota bacterium]